MRDAFAIAQDNVIGSLLIDPDGCAGLIFQKARSEYFSSSAHRHVFAAALEIWRERKPLDVMTILSAIGGGYEQFLRDCMTSTVTTAPVESFLSALEDGYKLSRFKAAASEIVYDAVTLSEAMAIWERLGHDVVSASTVRCTSWSEAIRDYLERMNDTKPLDYLSFGIEQLDNALNVGPGKFVVLAADSSAGKTALALQFAYHIAAAGKKVGFFSIETDRETLTDRLMSETQVAGIDLPKTKRRILTVDDYRRATDAGLRSDDIPLSLLDRCSTIDDIRIWTIQKGFDVIFVDYLQLIDVPGYQRFDIVTNASLQLHRLAQKLRVVIIALSQVTLEKGSTKLLTKDDLRESRQIKHDADIVMTLNVDPENKYKRILLIDKNKDDAAGKRMSLEFDPEHMTFSRLERKKRTMTGQTGLHELPDGAGGELPF